MHWNPVRLIFFATHPQAFWNSLSIIDFASGNRCQMEHLYLFCTCLCLVFWDELESIYQFLSAKLSYDRRVHPNIAANNPVCLCQDGLLVGL